MRNVLYLEPKISSGCGIPQIYSLGKYHDLIFKGCIINQFNFEVSKEDHMERSYQQLVMIYKLSMSDALNGFMVHRKVQKTESLNFCE